MADVVVYTVDYPAVYGLTLRSNGLARRYLRDITRDVARQSKINVTANSKARYSGYRRTGNLARGIKSKHDWANQHGAQMEVISEADYTVFVMEGTGGNGAGRIYSRGQGGQFGGRFPVGRSQGRTTAFKASVRGQRANPFLTDALRTVFRRRGL